MKADIYNEMIEKIKNSSNVQYVRALTTESEYYKNNNFELRISTHGHLRETIIHTNSGDVRLFLLNRKWTIGRQIEKLQEVLNFIK
jgi:hypothetical protein